MPRFVAKLIQNGQTVHLDVEAKTVEEARLIASKSGQIIELEKKNKISSGLTYSERQTFLIRLTAMLGSGIGAGEALRVMRGAFTGRIKQVSHEILLNLESGMDLPSAIESVGRPHFSENMIALIKAGSVGGSVIASLKEAVAFDKEITQIRKGASRGIVNVIVSFVLAAAIILVMVFVGLPYMMESDLIKSAGDKIDIGWAVTMSYVVGGIMVFMSAIVFPLIFLGTVGVRLFPKFSDNIIVRVPFYKDLVLAQKNYISFTGLSLLVQSGVRMEIALELTAKNTQPGSLQDDFYAASAAVKHGQKWALAMKTIHETDKVALSASLDRTQVAESLKVISDQYKEIYAERINVFVPTMQVISSLLMTLAGFIMFALTTFPAFQLTEGILSNY